MHGIGQIVLICDRWTGFLNVKARLVHNLCGWKCNNKYVYGNGLIYLEALGAQILHDEYAISELNQQVSLFRLFAPCGLAAFENPN